MRVAHIITRMILGGAQENTLLSCEDLLRIYEDDVLLVTGPSLGREGSLLQRAQAHQVPLAMIPSMRREVHPWRDTLAYRHIRRVIEAFKPDVVHTHSAKAGVLGRAAATAAHVPAIVHTVHGAPFHPYQRALARDAIRRCERWAAQRCDGLISVADAMTDLLVDADVAPREKFTTIYSGMEVEPFLDSPKHRENMRRALGYGEDDIVVGKVARLFHLKGHEYIIAAARELVPKYPQLRFMFVGDGVLRERLEREIAAAGLADHFQFVGLVPPGNVPKYLAATDIVAHTSLREGLARVLPQALLSGQPVVSFDVDGAREVVSDGETGYLVPPKDVDRLAHAISTLIEHPELRTQLGQTGRDRCAKIFPHQHMTEEIRALYQRLLTGKSEG
jgi:glycosyltransferase involved in cell wall biosynthesis